jgi:aspartyl-tRNA(Asn)/glutamyl-tRNA(Gln) amidotransferase subunit A
MISQLRSDILSEKTTATEIAREYLAKAKKLNKGYNSFISFCDELALASAKHVDEKVKKGEKLGKLAGIPIAVKDNILVQGYKATAASNILRNYTAVYDADVVRFLKQEDAVIIGKTNMDDAAMGSSSETSAFGRVCHHEKRDLVPGGSSGGSAVAVASGQVPVALGSDTGGSIRQPASFTGTVGLKPTYGRVSRFGLIAMASSLDQIGVFANESDDASIVLDVISQETASDSTYARRDFHASILSQKEALDDLTHMRIGVPEEYFTDGLDTKIKDAVNAAIERMSQAGARVQHIRLPSLAYALPCYYIIMVAEASSNLARYDNIRYSKVTVKSNSKSETLNDLYSSVRGVGFGKEVQRRILLGTHVLSAGYVDKYYVHAQKVRTKIREEFHGALKKVDIIIGPTSPTFPFKAGSKFNDPVAMYLADIYTVAANLTGLPAISVPLAGMKLPAGIQFTASPFEEGRLLALAKGIEALYRG